MKQRWMHMLMVKKSLVLALSSYKNVFPVRKYIRIHFTQELSLLKPL